MRSRYTAYVAGQVDHILATTHPSSPHHRPDRHAWATEVTAFCQQTAFEGLQIQHARAVGDQGWVQFVAHLRQANQPIPMQEHSEFRRVDGQWLYVQAITPDPAHQ